MELSLEITGEAAATSESRIGVEEWGVRGGG